MINLYYFHMKIYKPEKMHIHLLYWQIDFIKKQCLIYEYQWVPGYLHQVCSG